MIRRLILILVSSMVFFLCSHLGSAVAASSETLHKRALRAASAGKNQKAIELLTRAIKTDPDNFKFYNDRGVIYRRLGKNSRALADYRDSLQINPKYTHALNNRAALYLDSGKCKDAVEDLSKALKYQGLKLKLHYNRARAYYCIGDIESAIQDLKKTVAARPLDYRAITLLGDYLAELGRKKEALKCYRIAGGLTNDHEYTMELERKVHDLEAGKKKSTSSSKIVQNKRRTFHQWGKSSLVPNLAELEKKGLAEVREDLDAVSREIFKQGKFFQKNGEWQKALIRLEDTYGLVKRSRKRFAQAWLLMEMGRCHLALGEYSQAHEKLSDSLKRSKGLKQKYPTALILSELSKVNRAMGRNDEARKYVTMSGQLPPKGTGGYRAVNGTGRRYLRANALASLGPVAVGSGPGTVFKARPKKSGITIKRANSRSYQKAIRNLVKQLKRRRSRKDYREMTEILVKLTDLYKKSGLYENAARSLNAAIAFKLRTGDHEGLAGLLIKRGDMRIKAGKSVSALEDYVWASVLASNRNREQTAKDSSSKASKLAKNLTANPRILLTNLFTLWRNRIENSTEKEAPLLYKLGKIYQKARKNIAAGIYFERSKAAALVEGDGSGGTKGSSRSKYRLGMKMLKSLDYYKYLELKKNKA